MAEVWIPIHNYLGLYEISNQGNTRSIDRVVKINKFGTTYTKTYYGKVLATKLIVMAMWKQIYGKITKAKHIPFIDLC